jgi:Starch-binding associating with outer membrane
MKKILSKILVVLVVLSSVFYYNCETTDLELTDNPNLLSYDDAQPNLLLNKAQVSFARFVQNMGTAGAEVTRLKYMFGRQYQNAYSATFFNTEWKQAYIDVLKTLSIMKPLAEEKGNLKHLGMAQVLEAYTMITLVDYFGDVPYSEALNENIINPKPDNGAAIYSAALSLLDKAIVNFNATTPATLQPATDLYYSKNWTKWIKLANTLKLKIHVQSRLVNTNAMTDFNSIIAANNFISSSADDFQFKWSTTNANPDSRHPLYVDNYTVSGVDVGYQANWLMNVMKNEKSIQDPRMRYYFYRQVNDTPVNEQDLRCSIEPIPAHYLAGGHVFCRIPGNDGYWGRDHGNNEGLPNDRAKRTAVGVYPAGGRFDGNNFVGIASQTLGGQGAGITPIILASSVDFWRAEMALQPGGTGDAKVLMTAGIQKSLTKVRAFISVDPTAVLAQVPPIANDATYIAEVGTMYDAASEKMEIIMKEFFITLFGNGIDAYNAYRRTGFPKRIQPNVEENPGGYIRSFYYPASESNTNSNMPQKPNVGVRVFWDNNPTTGFPVAN